MNTQMTIWTLAAALLALSAPASASDPLQGYEPVETVPVLDPPAGAESGYPAESVDRGRYLVTLLGCGGCHTDGALAGSPNPNLVLAGSTVGIATSNPMQKKFPGVVFPPNLTPDPETGLGNWSVEQIATLMRSGTDSHGNQALPVMPWMAYSKLSRQDADAIAIYLKSLPAVRHKLPADVRPGKQTKAPFVHFGVYRSRQN